MAKKETTRTSIDEINESLSSFEQKVENNKKYIYWITGGIVVLALIILGYVYGIHNPNMEKAKNEIAKADMDLSLGNDSVALAEYLAVASNYSNEPANRASLNAAIILYKEGKFQEAADAVKNFDAEGTIVGPASQSLLGDCYVNLKKYDEAISAFDKAVKLSGDNALYTPLFLMKKATVLRELKNFKAEAEIYSTIREKYPEFAANYNVDVEKYLVRAQQQAGE
ncbi:MAG: tetratricopeptide repeat protein [Bacteroidales bacterium]|nr:tetratricopeptide repeat protein [Bacteroidales bacterium]